MKYQDVVRIVEEKCGPLAVALGLASWSIRFNYGPCGEKVAARCKPDLAYETAEIDVDHEAMDDEADLLRKLRHELLHATLAEVDGPISAAVHAAFVGRDEAALNAVVAVLDYGAERQVRAIESMLDRLGATPEELVKRGEWLIRTPPCDW